MTILSFAVNVTQNTTISFILYFSALAIDGIFGSAGTPIGRAAYFDVWAAQHDGYQWKDRLVTDTNIAQALTWILVCLSQSIFEKMLIPISLFALVISLLFGIFMFKDLRDKDDKLVEHEMKEAAKKYLKGYALRLMIAFLFYDLAFQFINYLAEEFYSLDRLRKDFLLVEGSGIFLGSLVARTGFTYVKKFQSSYKTILIFSLALFAIFLTPWLRSFLTGKFILDNVTFLSFSSIGGVVLALSFGYFSHKVRSHETGLLFGIMEGIEIFAEGLISFSFFFGNWKQCASNAHIATFTLLLLIGIGVIFILKKEKKMNLKKKLAS